MDGWIGYVVQTIIGIAITIIGFFLKSTIAEVKETSKAVQVIREDYTPKRSHEKDFDAMRGDIAQIKDDYLTKEDFYRAINDVNRTIEKVDSRTERVDEKLDKLMDMMLRMTGGNDGSRG